MATFKIRTATASGKIEERRIEAPHPGAIPGILAKDGMILLSAEELDTGGGPSARTPPRAILEFTRILAVLLKAGLSLEAGLEVAEDSMDDKAGKRLAKALRERLMKGESFSQGLAAQGDLFPPLYLGMVRIGEKTGKLEPVLSRVAQYLEDQKKMSDKVKGAMIYPIIVLSLLGALILGVIFFLVPGLENIFSSLGGGLPHQTQVAMYIIKVFGWAIAFMLAVGLALAATVRVKRAADPNFKRYFDALLLKAPLIGHYLTLRHSVDFSFAMETLVNSGIGVEHALAEAISVVPNEAWSVALREIREKLMTGERLSRSFSAASVLPKEFARWATVGEKTGNVEALFSQTREFFSYELERWTTRITALIEPGLIVFVGIILIGVVLLFIVPFLTSFTSIV